MEEILSELRAIHECLVNYALVQHIRPARLTTNEAALYIRKSASWLRQARLQDRERLGYGGKCVGPQWHVDGKKVFYTVKQLDSWLESRIERGDAYFEHKQELPVG